jgi:uncharacterized protein with HEPN domain
MPFINDIKNTELNLKFTMGNKDDENDNLSVHNIRQIRDKVTDRYVSVILNDVETRSRFVDYTYNKINYYIQKINQKLLQDGKRVLNPHEQIILLYKGGNVISEYYHTFMGDNNLYDNDFKKDLDKNFKISDVDYSVYIDTDNDKRFSEIHNRMIVLLGEALKEISTEFDTYYDAVMNNRYVNRNIQINDNNKLSDINYTLLETLDFSLRQCIQLYYENVQLNTIMRDAEALIDVDIINHIGHPQSPIYLLLGHFITNLDENTLNILDGLLVKNILINLKFLIEKQVIRQNIINYNLDNKLTAVDNILVNILNNKRHKLFESFYSIQKIGNITTFIKNLFRTPYNQNNDAPEEKTYYNLEGEGVKKFRLTVNNKQNNNFNVVIKKRKNIIINYKSIKNTDDSAYHYISYNNIIRKLRNEKIVTDFDLIRIKFNVEADNYIEVFNNENNTYELKSLKIPSEFIDVSVPKFFDSPRTHYFHNNHNKTNFLSLISQNFHFTVMSYSLTDIINDLEYVLYSDKLKMLFFDIRFLNSIF